MFAWGNHENDIIIDRDDNDKSVKSYEHDRTYMQQIKNGDVEAILLNRKLPKNDLPTSYKQLEYFTCSAITLASYAAIEGGLSPARAYAMCDLYFQKLELCKNTSEIKQIYDDVELTFAQQVHLINLERVNTSYVEKCKLFIDQNLHIPFTLDDVATALSINKSYLSRRFAQEAGIRIMEYTRQKRIQTAAYMLKYSDKTISAISENLCFSTQSHFGNLFKQIMGMTPLKYRTANQVIDIENKSI